MTINKTSGKLKIKHPTCSLCAHYNPFKSTCGLTEEYVDGYDMSKPEECKKEGKYVRYTNAIPHYMHYYGQDSLLTSRGADFSRCPTKDGVPLFVGTARGLEIPIPANSSVKEFTFSPITGVPLIETYQGQRQLIYELGVKLAQEVADEAGVELTILEGEENSRGHMVYIEGYFNERPQRTKQRRSSIAEEPIPEW